MISLLIIFIVGVLLSMTVRLLPDMQADVSETISQLIFLLLLLPLLANACLVAEGHSKVTMFVVMVMAPVLALGLMLGFWQLPVRATTAHLWLIALSGVMASALSQGVTLSIWSLMYALYMAILFDDKTQRSKSMPVIVGLLVILAIALHRMQP